MKAILLILVVALAIGAASIVKPATRANLNVGYAAYGDRLLNRSYVYQPAIPNTIQYQDFWYRGNYSTRISAVYATEVGYTQYASAWIIGGGVGYNYVTVRVQSARGYGYYYSIEVWGR